MGGIIGGTIDDLTGSGRNTSVKNSASLLTKETFLKANFEVKNHETKRKHLKQNPDQGIFSKRSS